jgi:hypothetical protein
MKLARALSDSEAKKVQTFVLLGGVFTTLTMWTKLEDPINLPKMFVLVLSAAIVLGLAFPTFLSARKLSSPTQQIGLGLIGLFGICLVIATLATDVKYTAIFGEFHRNNGFLAYLAMIILMAAGSLVFNLNSASRYFTFFGTAGVLLSFYGIVQGLTSHRDFLVFQVLQFYICYSMLKTVNIRLGMQLFCSRTFIFCGALGLFKEYLVLLLALRY